MSKTPPRFRIRTVTLIVKVLNSEPRTHFLVLEFATLSLSTSSRIRDLKLEAQPSNSGPKTRREALEFDTCVAYFAANFKTRALLIEFVI